MSKKKFDLLIRALCEDDMGSGSGLGDLQVWSADGDIAVGYRKADHKIN